MTFTREEAEAFIQSSADTTNQDETREFKSVHLLKYNEWLFDMRCAYWVVLTLVLFVSLILLFPFIERDASRSLIPLTIRMIQSAESTPNEPNKLTIGNRVIQHVELIGTPEEINYHPSDNRSTAEWHVGHL